MRRDLQHSAVIVNVTRILEAWSMRREPKIRKLIGDELKRYFHTMSIEQIEKSIQNYKSVKDKKKRARRMALRDPPPTDFNEEVIQKFGSRIKCMKAITKDIQKEISKRFGIASEHRIKGTNFQVDLFDKHERVCYEIALGNGTEIFKDVLKALLLGAEKLVIFSRSYPNPWGMIGFDYIKRHWEAMKDKIELDVEIIEFASGKSLQ